jgi:hypothetical protein
MLNDTHIFSKIILDVEAQNSRVYGVSFVVHLWMKIVQNESGWFSVLGCLRSLVPQFLTCTRPMTALLTTVEIGNGHIRTSIRACQFNGGYIVK